MNFDSFCNLMEDKQLLKSQQKEYYEAEAENHARTYKTCKSNLIVQRDLPSSSYHHCMYIYNSSDWEICEELRIRELEEAKARTAQMEKTMRWWSDCTANWREKWSKVRAERNKAREEGRQLKLKLEATIKEMSALKKIKQHLLSKDQEIENENIWKKNVDSSELCWTKEDHTRLLEKEPLTFVQHNKICDVDCVNQDVCTTENPLEYQDIRINLEILNSGGKCTPAVSLDNPNPSKDHPIHSQDDEVMYISMLHLRLHESQKILHKEQKIRSSLEKEVEKLKTEKSLWKWKYDELKISTEGSLKQFSTPGDPSQNDGERTLDDLEKETGVRTQKDTKIHDLLAEIEILQSENASEWGKRKILETEKQELARENRRLKTYLKELQDLYDRKNKLSEINLCGNLQATQTELLGKNKAYAEVVSKQHQLQYNLYYTEQGNTYIASKIILTIKKNDKEGSIITKLDRIPIDDSPIPHVYNCTPDIIIDDPDISLKLQQKNRLDINRAIFFLTDCMELQLSDSELNKQEQDILAELMRTRKRVEQHKAEAKELSIRVEDLRRKLKQTEDKV